MIKEIRKAENGFRITTDKGEIYLDYCSQLFDETENKGMI